MDVRDNTLRNIIKILKKSNFSSEQIKRIVSRYAKFFEEEKVLEENYQKYKHKMEEFGFEEEEINELISYNPTLIYYHYYKDWDSYLAFFKENASKGKIDARCLYNQFVEILSNLGLKNERIDDIIQNNYAILYFPKKSIKENIEYYKKHDIPKKALCKIIENNADILTKGYEDFQIIKKLLAEFDLTLSDFLTMFARQDKKFDLDMRKYERILVWVLDKDINKKRFADYIKSTPVALDTSVEVLEERYNALYSFGFNKTQVKHIVDDNFVVLTMETDKIKAKIDVMNDFNYTEDEKVKIIDISPFYLGLTINNLRKKFEAAKAIGLLRYLARKPKVLMQGAELALARYYYLKRYYPEELIGDYGGLVYSSQEKFQNKFNAGKNYLLVIYRDHKKLEKRLARKKK